VFGFLTEIIGLAPAQVAALRDAPGSQDALSVAAATLPREARALASADLVAAGRQVKQPVRLLLGEHSPPWARQLTDELAAVLPAATVAALPGVGHEGLQGAPGLVAAEVLRFLDG
jgi:pimeloyl-ACP methyl ester carboxylesterase